MLHFLLKRKNIGLLFFSMELNPLDNPLLQKLQNLRSLFLYKDSHRKNGRIQLFPKTPCLLLVHKAFAFLIEDKAHIIYGKLLQMLNFLFLCDTAVLDDHANSFQYLTFTPTPFNPRCFMMLLTGYSTCPGLVLGSFSVLFQEGQCLSAADGFLCQANTFLYAFRLSGDKEGCSRI